MLHLIEHNNKVIGSYTDHEQAELFIDSCIQNNLMKNAKILTFKNNSCFLVSSKVYEKKVEEIEIVKIEEIKTEKVIEIYDLEESKLKEEKNEETKKESVKLQHKINILKNYKKKIEESKVMYDNDLKLYNLFSENKNNDEKFIIPELFIEKYNLFNRLKEKNDLCWETFFKEYKTVNYYDDHFKLTSYEDNFLQYESDSETEDSNNAEIIEELNI